MIQRNGDERAERRFRIALFGVLLLVLVGVHFVDPSFYPTIYQLSMDGDLKGTIAYLKTFGVYAAFMSFFIDVVINVVGFLPSIFISTANGLIFGLFWDDHFLAGRNGGCHHLLLHDAYTLPRDGTACDRAEQDAN